MNATQMEQSFGQRLKENNIVQAWLVLTLALFFGASLAASNCPWHRPSRPIKSMNPAEGAGVDFRQGQGPGDGGAGTAD